MKSIAQNILDECLNLFLIVSLTILFNVFLIEISIILFWDWDCESGTNFDRKLNCTDPV